MHAIEKELIDVTKHTSRKKYTNRQDYLGSILNAAMKLTDDDFDNLTDAAAAWVNAAIASHNVKEDFPDFDDEVPTDDEEDAPADDDETVDEEPEDEPEDAGESEDDDEDVEVDEDEEPEDEAEKPEEEPVKPSKKEKRPKAPPPVKKSAAPKAVGPKPRPTKTGTELDEDEDVVLDKWGCMEGSKNSRALGLFEKGATTKEVKDAIGGTFYNILKKMQSDGHILEKEGALIKLIHKDAAKPAKVIAKKKK